MWSSLTILILLVILYFILGKYKVWKSSRMCLFDPCCWWLAEKCHTHIYIINNIYLYIIIVYYVLVLYLSSFKQPPAKYLTAKIWRHMAIGIMGNIEMFCVNGIKEVVVCWLGRGERSVDLHMYFTLLSSVCHVHI